MIDNLAEKNSSFTPYNYVENNPLLFIDPDGNDKFKAQAHFKLSTGFLGAGIKALGIKYSFGGTEREISINISYDTETNVLSIGGSSLKREKGANELTMGGVFGGGETTEKETGTEVFAGFNFGTGEFVAEKKEIKDEEFKDVGEATISVLTGSEKEDEGNTIGVGLNPEVNLGLIGVGSGVNLTVQPDGNNNTNNQKQENNIKTQEKDEKDNL